jgi:hypothetical protein
MKLIRTETGKWALLELTDEDVAGIYFASSDYASRLKMELTTRTIGGKPIGEEDVEFLAEAGPRAERVWDRVSEATETILEQANII